MTAWWSPKTMPAALGVSVVVYRPDLEALDRTLRTLAAALGRARDAGLLGAVEMVLVDNGSADPGAVDCTAAAALAGVPNPVVRTIRGQGNVGYGRGHNLAIRSSRSDYYLVLNPDVLIDPDALVEALRFLEREPSIGLVAPSVEGELGERQYLCRRYPDLLTLFLRGFAPAAVRRSFAGRLARYEMRDLLRDKVVREVPIASGCFMFARTAVLQAVNGFSDNYFLYFEDYDLSLRVRRHAAIAYVPSVRIVHFGGEAARKGGPHVRLFLTSAFRFFQTHGWRVA